jgi:hypothetical protein
VFQFPLPVPVPEKRQTGGTEPAHNEALTPASWQSEVHPLSDDEVVEVKHEVSNQHISTVVAQICPSLCYIKHLFLQFYPTLLSKMVTLKIKFSYDS